MWKHSWRSWMVKWWLLRKTRDFYVSLLYYVSNFAESWMKVPRYQSSPTSRYLFFSSVYSAAVKCSPKLLPFGVNCPQQLAGLGKKERKLWSQLALRQKRLRHHRHHRQISQCSSPVEALNLIVESKSQPVELDNLTIELHVPLRRKNSLQSYCFVNFDFLDLMWFDMTFDVTLRDDSSFGKLTNSCN